MQPAPALTDQISSLDRRISQPRTVLSTKNKLDLDRMKGYWSVHRALEDTVKKREALVNAQVQSNAKLKAASAASSSSKSTSVPQPGAPGRTEEDKDTQARWKAAFEKAAEEAAADDEVHTPFRRMSLLQYT